MPISKRVFDVCVAAAALAVCWPIIVICAALIALLDRQPPFFGARRMCRVERPFVMWKLRTMRGRDDGLPTGGSKAHLITPLGQVLRRWHLDELPQLWNVCVGDMSLVGPRPPTAFMVGRHPEVFQRVLSTPPGITGLATVRLVHREVVLLASSKTNADLERLYTKTILHRKARLDCVYAKNPSFRLDLWILVQTLRVILSGHPPRAGYS